MESAVRVAFPEVAAADVPSVRRSPVDGQTRIAAAGIVDDVRDRGEAAVREHAERLGDVEPGASLYAERWEMEEALGAIDGETRRVLERAAGRIRAFAEAQRASVGEFRVAVPGGHAAQVVAPVERAGCYAPGGRFPLPSSVLMGAVTARAAGCERVVVASPRPAPVTLAAAALAGADLVLRVGGAQAIGAMAYGCGPIESCDAIVGPGNRWVTAAKQRVSGAVRIDMLAGPSELVVLADDSADAGVVASDLLAQAEHDADASAVLVTTSRELLDAVRVEISEQLATLPTRETAMAAMGNSFGVVACDLGNAIDVCDRLAPEHLEVITRDASDVAGRLRHYGGLFVGGSTAEVLGDYGAGPNHTLPTGGTARSFGGLSVFDFLRIRTVLEIGVGEEADALSRDSALLARAEGLEGHARSAERRLGGC